MDRLLYILLLVVISVASSYGQTSTDEKIKTDRPDATEASSVVPKGTFQLESGFRYQKDSENGLDTKLRGYPTALLRVGLLDWLELRLINAYRDSVIENGVRQRVSGFGPLSVGTKVKLWEESGWRPEAALIARAVLPVGSTAFRPDNINPHLRLAFSNELTDKLELAYNLAYGWVEGDPLRAYTLNFNMELSDRLTGFVELVGRKEEDEAMEHQALAGFMFLVRRNLQLDLAGGIGLNDAAPDYFITTGLSVRLPN